MLPTLLKLLILLNVMIIITVGNQTAHFELNDPYWIKPFHFKGQLGLPNVDDQLIQQAPVTGQMLPGAQRWFQRVIVPLH